MHSASMQLCISQLSIVSQCMLVCYTTCIREHFVNVVVACISLCDRQITRFPVLDAGTILYPSWSHPVSMSASRFDVFYLATSRGDSLSLKLVDLCSQ